MVNQLIEQLLPGGPNPQQEKRGFVFPTLQLFCMRPSPGKAAAEVVMYVENLSNKIDVHRSRTGLSRPASVPLRNAL